MHCKKSYIEGRFQNDVQYWEMCKQAKYLVMQEQIKKAIRNKPVDRQPLKIIMKNVTHYRNF